MKPFPKQFNALFRQRPPASYYKQHEYVNFNTTSGRLTEAIHYLTAVLTILTPNKAKISHSQRSCSTKILLMNYMSVSV